MDTFVHYDGPRTPFTQSLALFWPADHQWRVATAIDFHSTLVGGTTAVVDVPPGRRVGATLQRRRQSPAQYLHAPTSTRPRSSTRRERIALQSGS